MRRRGAVSVLALLCCGCVDRAQRQVSTVVDESESEPTERPLGETVTQNDVAVSVTDSQTANSVSCVLSNQDDSETLPSDEFVSVVEPPGNAELWLAKISVENQDIESREIPRFNPASYQDDSSNDIMIYGDGEKAVAEASRTLEFGYERLEADGEELPPYPVGALAEDIEANSTVSGWVFGVIEKGATPALKIDLSDSSYYWQLN